MRFDSFPHPLLMTPRPGNREIRVKQAPVQPLARKEKEEKHEERT